MSRSLRLCLALAASLPPPPPFRTKGSNAPAVVRLAGLFAQDRSSTLHLDKPGCMLGSTSPTELQHAPLNDARRRCPQRRHRPPTASNFRMSSHESTTTRISRSEPWRTPARSVLPCAIEFVQNCGSSPYPAQRSGVLIPSFRYELGHKGVSYAIASARTLTERN
jgi:hypothetical protein